MVELTEFDKNPRMANRFRGYLPVVVDVETAGFNPATDALLEVAAVIVNMDEMGLLSITDSKTVHVVPFEGANLEASALAFNGIDPYHPLRLAVSEHDALAKIFGMVRKAVKANECQRAILVGHNPAFDIAFVNAAAARQGIKRNPFHPFCTFDTATLGGLAYGQTVLARAVQSSGMSWDSDQAHSALYDAERTARLFCRIVNDWDRQRRQDDSLRNIADTVMEP